MTSPVLEILLPSKTAKFPFWGMDNSPWSSKYLIDWNQLKKIMQVGVDIKCMHTSFGGCGLSSFGDIQCCFGKHNNFSISISFSINDKFILVLVLVLVKFNYNFSFSISFSNQK